MSTNPNPIYVMAGTYHAALAFVEVDLRESGRRLVYLEREDRMRGLDNLVVYIHPTALTHRNYHELLRMARMRGAILCRIDDSSARERYNRETKR